MILLKEECFELFYIPPGHVPNYTCGALCQTTFSGHPFTITTVPAPTESGASRLTSEVSCSVTIFFPINELCAHLVPMCPFLTSSSATPCSLLLVLHRTKFYLKLKTNAKEVLTLFAFYLFIFLI